MSVVGWDYGQPAMKAWMISGMLVSIRAADTIGGEEFVVSTRPERFRWSIHLSVLLNFDCCSAGGTGRSSCNEAVLAEH